MHIILLFLSNFRFIGENKLSSLPADIFQNLQQLEQLCVRAIIIPFDTCRSLLSNALTTVQLTHFASLTELQFLFVLFAGHIVSKPRHGSDLSRNELHLLPAAVFHHNTKLETLYQWQ